MAEKYTWSMNVMVARGSLAESITRKWTEAGLGKNRRAQRARQWHPEYTRA